MPDTASQIPRATYRLQLTKDFSFAQAGALAPYLQRLGISHAYLSPVLKARKGSTHGYDTVDHTVLNPELGTRADFEDMAERFKSHGIGIILDIVPNHMGIGGEDNLYWLDVLEQGPASPYAEWFDINWSPGEPTLKNKILVPFLGTSLAEALEHGEIGLRHDAARATLAVWAGGTHKLPLRRDTYAMVATEPSRLHEALAHLNSPQGRADLEAIIQAQYWRLARFSVAADDINYRRFFTVSDLAGIRVEREEVFDHVHRLVFELIDDGLVQGLRVDHIDGLYDPVAYCRDVRQKAPRPIYLVVEKIFAPHEVLPASWHVDGTTGYEFGGAVSRLLVDPATEATLTSIYQGVTGQTRSFRDIEHGAKLEIIDHEMAAELGSITTRLYNIATGAAATRDLTFNTLRNVLREVVAAMPVYRIYVAGAGISEADRDCITNAVATAHQALAGLDPAAFDFVAAVLSGEFGHGADGALSRSVIDAAQRAQQFTGPVMAKGLEDTALYRFNRLIALNDVGQKPDRWSEGIAGFHEFNIGQAERTPHCMLATSSHDTKRGEDARARIAALSGYPKEWEGAVTQWTRLLDEAGAPVIDPNDRYFFFQLLLGSWPLEMSEELPFDVNQLAAFRTRVDAAMRKSVREARVRTNWNAPSEAYEAAVSQYVATALEPDGAFLHAFLQFDGLISHAGAQDGLIQTVLKLTVPGVPDIYQGAEFWEQSMVDPDNRRPVDFGARVGAIDETSTYPEMMTHWRDGRIKQRIIADLLACRSAHPYLFAYGSYEPVPAGESICAFFRRGEGADLLVAVQLYPWRGRTLNLTSLAPIAPTGKVWRPIVGSMSTPTTDLSPDNLFRELPMAVLLSATE